MHLGQLLVGTGLGALVIGQCAVVV